MKRIVVLVVFAVALALAGSAMADLGSQLGGAIKGAAKKEAAKQVKGAVVNELNKDLGSYNCNYDKKTKAYKDCNIKELAAKVQAQSAVTKKAGSEAGSYTTYNLYVKTNNSELYNSIKNDLTNKYQVKSWNISQDASGAKDAASFYVKVE